MNRFIYLLLFLIIMGCEEIPESRYKFNYSEIPNFSRNGTIRQSLIFDSIPIYMGGDNMTSMEGIFFMQKDSIYFGDRQLATVFVYDTTGQFITTRTRQGKGPGEILGLNVISPLKDQGFAIMDEQWNVFLFDKHWNSTNQYIINWQVKKSAQALLNSPDPNESGIYEVEYAANNLRLLGNYLIFPIVTEHIHYNGYESGNGSHFYENSYTLALMDQKKGIVTKMFCNRSPVYRQYKYIPNFKNVIFDTYADSLFFSFEADSLIYKMNIRDSSLLSFGIAGKSMNISYIETKSFKESDDNFFHDRETFGYYRYLKYIPETNVLFRGYSTGKPTNMEKLQIYKNNDLLLDTQVPANFQPFGYHAPYYYATGKPDYNKDHVVVYKFKLNTDAYE